MPFDVELTITTSGEPALHVECGGGIILRGSSRGSSSADGKTETAGSEERPESPASELKAVRDLGPVLARVDLA